MEYGSTEWAEWLAQRRKGLGGSDAPKVTGLSPYGGPFDVYADKTGIAEEKEETAELQRGRLLEDAVAQWYVEETGRTVVRVPGILKHPAYPWMLASLDRAIVGEDRGLECKTTTRHLGATIFDDWECQVQHYMGVTGYPVFDVAVLSGGLDFQMYEVQRDDDYIANLITIEEDFWYNHVVAGVPPEMDGSRGASAYVAARYPKDDGTTVEAGPEEAEIVRLLLAVKNQQKADARDRARLENLLKDRIGAATTLSGPDFRVTWKRTKDVTKVDWSLLAKTYEAVIEAARPVLESTEWDNKDETLLTAGIARSLYTEVRPGTRRLLVRGTKGEALVEETEEGEDA